MPLTIVHTYIKNMGINQNKPNQFTFAERWGLISQVDLGHNIILICGGDSKERKEYYWKGIKIIELPSRFQLTSSSRILKGFSRELLSISADVFHTHHYCSFIPEITALIAKKRKIPVFITIHSSFEGRSGISRIFESLYLFFMRFFFPLYSTIFLISEYYMDNCKSFSKVPFHQKKLLHNYFQLPPLIEKKKQKDSILFISRLVHMKGLDILIRALEIIKKEIPDVQLNIVGEGLPSYKQNLVRLINALGLEKNVVFHGELFGDEKWKHFYTNIVLVLPLRDLGLGNVAIEGLMCRMPVLVSNKWALPSVMIHEENVFDIDNLNDIATKIINVLRNEKIREKLLTGVEEQIKIFTTNNIGQKIIETYVKYLNK